MMPELVRLVAKATGDDTITIKRDELEELLDLDLGRPLKREERWAINVVRDLILEKIGLLDNQAFELEVWLRKAHAQMESERINDFVKEWDAASETDSEAKEREEFERLKAKFATRS